MLIPPPDPKEISPSDLWRAFLSERPRREITIDLAGVGRVRFFVRAIGSFEWVRLHVALARAFELGEPGADAAFVSALVEHEDGASLTTSEIASLYEHEQTTLFAETVAALRIISPTYATIDTKAWLDRLKEGARAIENICDVLSLGGCVDVSYGFGAVHVRDRPEDFFGVPKKNLIDCQWLAYHAARSVAHDLGKKS